MSRLSSVLSSVNTAKWIHANQSLTCSDTNHIHMLSTSITIDMTNKAGSASSILNSWEQHMLFGPIADMTYYARVSSEDGE
eukprot:scaffold341693_cov225-Cyclotella_meneghiniana.AAC.1